MGVLNVTPDSFHPSSRYTQVQAAIERAGEMLDEGADWIDVGGESTRPGASPVDPEEELQRVVPVISGIRNLNPDAAISIDTRRAVVAEAALEAGADLVNDVSGLRDPAMRDLVLEQGCGVCIMHMQGEPAKMQQSPEYADVIEEVSFQLLEMARSLVDQGHPKDSICLDPGIGFGKTLEHNLKLLTPDARSRLAGDEGFAVLWGVSRKSMFRDLLGHKASDGRLSGTLGVAAEAQALGVDILRVHDVAAHADMGTVLARLEGGR